MEGMQIIAIMLAALVNVTTIIGLHVRTQGRLVKLETQVQYLIQSMQGP